MSRTISFKTTFALASVSVFAALAPALAQEEEAEGETSAAAVEVAGESSQKAAKAFRQVMRCVRAAGKVQVLRPRTSDWVDAVEGHFYPFGSKVRVEGVGVEKPNVEFEFGEKSSVVITDPAEFKTREVVIGEPGRVIELVRGRINLNFPRTLGEGLLKVVAPAFCCENIAGESIFDYSLTNDGDEVVVRCVTGTVSLKGSHYSIPRMGAANQIRIRTTGDQLFSSIRGESGDCKVVLDKGVGTVKDFENGTTKEVLQTLEFSLSPQCAIKIFRAKSEVGGRMCVSAMTFSPSGEMLNRFAFAEGLAIVNSGELVVPEKIPEDVKSSKDEEEETVEVAAPAKGDAEAAEESDGDKKDEKKEDEA